jgi:hypothetical protein
MITAVLCFIAALWIPGLILLLVSVRRAPVGFEDAKGFHAVEEHACHEVVFASVVRAS